MMKLTLSWRPEFKCISESNPASPAAAHLQSARAAANSSQNGGRPKGFAAKIQEAPPSQNGE
jgi:hypothetical protein